MTDINSNTTKEQGLTQPAAKPDWRFLVSMGLSIGIGLPIARGVSTAIWPGDDAFWGQLVVGTAVAGVAGAIIALAVGGIFERVRKQ